jgi:hypothetical protein
VILCRFSISIFFPKTAYDRPKKSDLLLLESLDSVSRELPPLKKKEKGKVVFISCSKRENKKKIEMADQPPHEEEEYMSSEDEWAAPAKPLETPANGGVGDVQLDQLEGDERELAQDVAPVFFTVPANGESFRISFAMGQTVGYLKGRLEDLKGWPYERIILTLLLRDETAAGEGGVVRKRLIDPLSLNDLPFVAQQDNVVEVTFTPE